MPPSPDRGPVTAPDHRLDRLPRRRRRLVALLLLAALLAVVYPLTVWAQTLVGDDPVDWVQPVPAMLASFAGGYVGMRIQRRRLGGADRLREYDRALRAGRLPDDADPAVWEPLLERELRVQQRAMRLSYGVVVLLAAMWVLIAVLYDIDPAWWLVAAAVLVLFAVFLRWVGHRQARRIRRLLDRMTSEVPSAG